MHDFVRTPVLESRLRGAQADGESKALAICSYGVAAVHVKEIDSLDEFRLDRPNGVDYLGRRNAMTDDDGEIALDGGKLGQRLEADISSPRPGESSKFKLKDINRVGQIK